MESSISFQRRRSPMPSDAEMEQLFDRARTAVLLARDVRAQQRRQRRLDRCEELARALERVSAAAQEVKRERNRSAYETRHERLFGARLRAASAALRTESKALRKMRAR